MFNVLNLFYKVCDICGTKRKREKNIEYPNSTSPKHVSTVCHLDHVCTNPAPTMCPGPGTFIQIIKYMKQENINCLYILLLSILYTSLTSSRQGV